MPQIQMNTFKFDKNQEILPKFLEQENVGTETVDLENLVESDLSPSGSFYLAGMEASSLAKLLHALPIPAFLIDRSHLIMFANRACGAANNYYEAIKGMPFANLFVHPEHAHSATSFLSKVFTTRRSSLTTTLLRLNGQKIWGRMHFRSMRAWQERSVLVLLEDLTHEKRQFLLTRRHKEELHRAHNQLEKRVEERTAELKTTNDQLEREITDRTRAEQELEMSRAGFTSIVEKSQDGIIVVDLDGFVRYSNPAAVHLFGSSETALAHARFDLPLGNDKDAEIPIVTVNGTPGIAEMHITNTDWHGQPAYLAMLRDTTERKQAEYALRQSEHRYKQMFVRMRAVKMLIDSRTGAIVDANPAAAKFYGHSVEVLKSINLVQLVAGSQDEIRECVDLSVSETRNYFEMVHKLASGEVRDVEMHTGPIDLLERKLLYAIIHDVTDRRKAEEKLNLSAKIIESSNEAIVSMDFEGNVINVNQAFCGITGYSREEVIGRNLRMLQWGREDLYKEIWASVKETGAWQGEVWDRKKTGEIYPKLFSLSAIKNSEAVITHYVGIFSDITKIKKAEKHLQHLAHFDPLTRLPNRLLFRDRLQRAIIEADRRRNMASLMLLDLDRFKNINDTLGHSAGDKLLISVAERLQESVRKSDTVARIGGDEFTIVLPETPSNLSAANVARKIVETLSRPFYIDGREVFVTTSVGVTLYPNDGIETDRLLQNADMALYHAKQLGKNNFQFFSEEMNIEAVERSELEASLRGALERDELDLYYQPRLNLRTGAITDVEALLRWRHPVRGLIYPAEFIGVAEETGLILAIGDWVVRTACRQNVKWQGMKLPPINVAVNVSARQLGQDDLVQKVGAILEETGMDPSCLELELTESVAMENAESTIKIFTELKRMGVGISIDDFGTGYSSLSYLKRFPIDKLKIDQSFVKDIASNSDDEAIVKAIIAVAHSLKLKVVAEGVETKEQLRFLRQHNCDEWQGYYFAKAVPADELTELLRRNAAQAG